MPEYFIRSDEEIDTGQDNNQRIGGARLEQVVFIKLNDPATVQGCQRHADAEEKRQPFVWTDCWLFLLTVCQECFDIGQPVIADNAIAHQTKEIDENVDLAGIGNLTAVEAFPETVQDRSA